MVFMEDLKVTDNGSKDYVFFNTMGNKDFGGGITDTGDNRNSIMLMNTYQNYYTWFIVPMRINYSDKKAVIGVSVKNASIGTASILIPFSGFQIVIDADFRILSQNFPKLL